jgi:hypothetical protein
MLFPFKNVPALIKQTFFPIWFVRQNRKNVCSNSIAFITFEPGISIFVHCIYVVCCLCLAGVFFVDCVTHLMWPMFLSGLKLCFVPYFNGLRNGVSKWVLFGCCKLDLWYFWIFYLWNFDLLDQKLTLLYVLFVKFWFVGPKSCLVLHFILAPQYYENVSTRRTRKCQVYNFWFDSV